MSAPLAGCVSSLQSSIQLLGSSISILDTGVNDYPRLSRVLQTTRHFELLPESTLSSAQASLLASITPEITSLLGRVETHVERLERREQTLRAKAELLAGRLESQAGRGSGGGDGARRAGAGGAKPWLKKSEGKGGGAVQAGADAGEVDDAEDLEKGREALRMKQLRQKKERLSFAVERLTLQAQQKERQLRKSMAPVVGEEEEEEE